MVNPFKEARLELGLSLLELCQKVGVSVSTAFNLEKGILSRPNKKILAFYQKHGYDPEQLKQKYQQYLERIREV